MNEWFRAGRRENLRSFPLCLARHESVIIRLDSEVHFTGTSTHKFIKPTFIFRCFYLQVIVIYESRLNLAEWHLFEGINKRASSQ